MQPWTCLLYTSLPVQLLGKEIQFTAHRLILEDRELDDARVLTEAAIFADKTAVDEETVRLRSHIAQYRELSLIHIYSRQVF